MLASVAERLYTELSCNTQINPISENVQLISRLNIYRILLHLKWMLFGLQCSFYVLQVHIIIVLGKLFSQQQAFRIIILSKVTCCLFNLLTKMVCISSYLAFFFQQNKSLTIFSVSPEYCR